VARCDNARAMKIEHVALWTGDIEALRAFYEGHLGGRAGPRYARPGFASYFIEFGGLDGGPDGGPRLELMQMPGIAPRDRSRQDAGWIHVAFAVGSRADVDRMTAELAAAGVVVADPPHETGDGYYESVVLDPDGNTIELTAE
jgi:lactoylglutathione lyase